MKLLRTAIAVSALAALAGCVGVPVQASYYGPGYYPAPVVYAPAVGVYGGWHRGWHRHG